MKVIPVVGKKLPYPNIKVANDITCTMPQMISKVSILLGCDTHHGRTANLSYTAAKTKILHKRSYYFDVEHA
jgi:hypothetical protein